MKISQLFFSAVVLPSVSYGKLHSRMISGSTTADVPLMEQRHDPSAAVVVAVVGRKPEVYSVGEDVGFAGEDKSTVSGTTTSCEKPSSPPPPLPNLRLEFISCSDPHDGSSDDRYEDLVTVREQTLWPGQRHMCYLDADKDGIHFAAVLQNPVFVGVHDVLGVVSAYEKTNPKPFLERRTAVGEGRIPSKIAGTSPARRFVIRKFGVLEQFRGKGIGKWLLNAAEEYLAQRAGGMAGVAEIELDAREDKVGLYAHTGYELVGERFQKYGGGSSWYVKMAKVLKVAEE